MTQNNSIRKSLQKLTLAGLVGISALNGCNNTSNSQNYPIQNQEQKAVEQGMHYLGPKDAIDNSFYVDGFKRGDRIVSYYIGNPIDSKDISYPSLIKSVLNSKITQDYLKSTGSTPQDIEGIDSYNISDVESYHLPSIIGYATLDLSDQSRALTEKFARVFYSTDNHSLYSRNTDNNIKSARKEDTDLFIPAIINGKAYTLGVKIKNDSQKADSLESRVLKIK